MTLTVLFEGCASGIATAIVDGAAYAGTVTGSGCSATSWQALTVHGLPAGRRQLTPTTTPSGGMTFDGIALTN